MAHVWAETSRRLINVFKILCWLWLAIIFRSFYKQDSLIRALTHVHSDATLNTKSWNYGANTEAAPDDGNFLSSLRHQFREEIQQWLHMYRTVTYTLPLRHHLPVRESYKKNSPVYGSHKMAVLNRNCHAHKVMLLGHSIRLFSALITTIITGHRPHSDLRLHG